MVDMISQIKRNPTGIGHRDMILDRRALKGIGKMSTTTAMPEIENHGQITQEIAGNIVTMEMQEIEKTATVGGIEICGERIAEMQQPYMNIENAIVIIEVVVVEISPDIDLIRGPNPKTMIQCHQATKKELVIDHLIGAM